MLEGSFVVELCHFWRKESAIEPSNEEEQREGGENNDVSETSKGQSSSSSASSFLPFLIYLKWLILTAPSRFTEQSHNEKERAKRRKRKINTPPPHSTRLDSI